MIDERIPKPALRNEWWQPGWHWLVVLPLLFGFAMLRDQHYFTGWWALLAAFVFLVILGLATRMFQALLGEHDPRQNAAEPENGCPSDSPSAPRHPECAHRVDSRKKRVPSGDERIAASPIAAAAASAGGAEWRVIRAGNELGPMSLAELVEMALNGEIHADDLVKNHDGRWIKAREFDSLQEQLLLSDSREEAWRRTIDTRHRFHGIWLSKNALVIGGGVLLVLLLGFAAMLGASRRPTKDAFVRDDKIRGNAIKALAEMQAPKPGANDAIFYSNLALSAWLKKGDHNNAIRDYDEAIRLNPKDATAYTGRANVWLSKGDSNNTMPAKDYDQAIRDYNNAVKDYTEAIRLNPDDATAYDMRANAWWRKGESNNAVKDYTEAIRLNPNNAGYFLGRGNAWYSRKNYDRAIDDYDEAIRLNPSYAAAYENRGNAWRGKKDHNNAIRDYTAAIRLDPNGGGAYYNRGQEWFLIDSNKAIRDYSEAIRLNPNFILAYRSRGNAWSNSKEYVKATRDYDEAIRLDPNDADVFYLRGLSWFARKDYGSAICDYNEAIRLDPNTARFYCRRGYTWAMKNDYDSAINDYNEAIRLDPNDALSYSCRGSAWHNKNHFQNAQRDFDEASRLDPKRFSFK